MAFLAASFKDDTKERRATKNLMKWLMPWHAPTWAAGGQPEAVTCARLTAPSGPSRALTILPGSLDQEVKTRSITCNCNRLDQYWRNGRASSTLRAREDCLRISCSNVGGWKLNIRHHYSKNFLISILMVVHWLQKFLLFQSIVEISLWLFSLMKIL